MDETTMHRSLSPSSYPSDYPILFNLTYCASSCIAGREGGRPLLPLPIYKYNSTLIGSAFGLQINEGWGGVVGYGAKIMKGIKIGKAFFLAVVNWPNSEFLWGICLYSLLVLPIKLTHVFMVVGWWVTVDFDSQSKNVRGKIRAHVNTHS